MSTSTITPDGRGLQTLHLRLDQVRGRVRLLHGLAGAARLVLLGVVTLLMLYMLDRWLVLPVAVRALGGEAEHQFQMRIGAESRAVVGVERPDVHPLPDRVVEAAEQLGSRPAGPPRRGGAS